MTNWREQRRKLLSDEQIFKNDLFVKVVGALVMRRKQLNLTQTELANTVGITQSNLARIENGDAIPKLDTFYKLVLALEMDIQLINKS